MKLRGEGGSERKNRRKGGRQRVHKKTREGGQRAQKTEGERVAANAENEKGRGAAIGRPLRYLYNFRTKNMPKAS